MRRWSVVKRPMCSPYSPTQQLTPHAPQHIPKSPPRTTPTPAPTRTACPPAPRTIPTPHHRPIHPRAPRHAPLPTLKTPTRLLPQPKPALQPPKPHLPTLPQLQQQQLQRHRQLPAPLARRNRVYPKRHRLAGFASLGALVMPTHDHHEKHPLAPPADTDPQPAPTGAPHARAPSAAPVASPCAVATYLWASTWGRSTPADAPAPKARLAAGRTYASLGACAPSRPCSATPACPTLWCRPARRRHIAAVAPRVLRR